MKQLCGSFGTHAPSSGQFVRRVTAKRNEIRHLLGIDIIPLADFCRTNSGDLACAHRENDRRIVGCELKRVAVTACHDSRSATALLSRDRGGEEIIRLVARRFRIGKAARSNKFRQNIELFNQCVVKLAFTLIRRKSLVSVSRNSQCIPADKHGARMLLLVEPQQEVCTSHSAEGWISEGRDRRDA